MGGRGRYPRQSAECRRCRSAGGDQARQGDRGAAARRARGGRDEAARRSGRRPQKAERDAAFHRYHRFELVVGALQIAIVLASVAVVTRILALAIGAGVIGAIAAGFALFVGLG